MSIYSFLGLMVGLLGYFWAYPAWRYSESGLNRQVVELNKSIPMKLSPEWEVKSVEALPGKNLTYHAEWHNDSDALPPNVSETIKTGPIRKGLAVSLCEDKVISEGLKRGWTVSYDLQTKDRVSIVLLTFNKGDCG